MIKIGFWFSFASDLSFRSAEVNLPNFTKRDSSGAFAQTFPPSWLLIDVSHRDAELESGAGWRCGGSPLAKLCRGNLIPANKTQVPQSSQSNPELTFTCPRQQKPGGKRERGEKKKSGSNLPPCPRSAWRRSVWMSPLFCSSGGEVSAEWGERGRTAKPLGMWSVA